MDYGDSLNKNWEIFKKKWGIPPDVAYGTPYDMTPLLRQGFLPVKHYFPLNPNEYSVSQGEELFTLGDLEGAKAVFERIVHRDPKNVEAFNNLGVIFFHWGEIDQAISYFTRVLEIDQNYFEASENLGNCMMAKKAYEDAFQTFKRALELKPDDIILLNSLGNCLIQKEDFSKAKEVYTKSYQIDCNQTHVGEILHGLEKLQAFRGERSIST